jgi:hypothetical protein
MKTTTLRELIRESIQGYIREIDMVSEVAAIESKIAEAKKAMDERQAKLDEAEKLNESGLIDEKKVKQLQKEVALLEKYASKQEALLEKKKAKMKGKNKEVDDDMITEEPMEMDEVDGLEEMDYKDDSMEEAKEEMEEEYLNESFIRMQKLAGVITEAQYNQKKNSLNKAPKTRIKLNENQGMVDYKDAKYYNEEGDYDDLQAYRDSPNEYPYDKVLSIFKDYEDERVVNDFKNTFKGKKFITRKEYGQFAEKYVDDASDGILIRANWISEDYPDIFDVMGL